MRLLAALQGAYFLITGLWPLISIHSFQVVTGRKTDLWLVKTVGVLITVIGFVLLLAAGRGAITSEVILLAVGCAASLAAIDLYYVARRVIAPIYLLDAGLEILLICGWFLGVLFFS
jgi:hypothetical protein